MSTAMVFAITLQSNDDMQARLERLDAEFSGKVHPLIISNSLGTH